MASKPLPNERCVERNITLRCDGYSYRVRMSIAGASINETFDTLQEARAYRDRMRADASLDPTHRLVLEARQRKSESQQITLAVLLERYMQTISPTKKSCTTESYRIKRLMRYPIAKLPAYLVNRDAVLRFMETARRESWSDNNLRKYLMLLSGLFQTALKCWGMEIDNPIRKIVLPSNGKSRERRLKAGEYERILEQIKRSPSAFLPPLFELAVETACRRGEMLKLLRKDVNLEQQTAVLRDTKNGDTRIIPLSTKAVSIITGLPRSIDGRLFPIVGDQVHNGFQTAVRRARKKYVKECKEAGKKLEPGYLEDLRFHDLRHEATSRIFERGFTLMEAASVTGHKTLSMLKRYTHLDARDLARKLG
ncbi:MAG: site-specific integrase [Burkholderiaceae bacterium]|nr:MAG: site-specific integrase [Burkholderiaceae bacterium]